MQLNYEIEVYLSFLATSLQVRPLSGALEVSVKVAVSVLDDA